MARVTQTFSTDPAFAAELDRVDPLGRFRDEFEIPPTPDGSGDPIYFVGNSLGPLPKRARSRIVNEIDRWSSLGVQGHFRGEPGWADYHLAVADSLGSLVGASAHEVVAMNSLTINLHLLMVSFYRPSGARTKVLIEDHAFPSDHFAVESQMRLHGVDPENALITVTPQAGSELLETADIVAAIDAAGDELAMVLLPGVQYYTGQVMPMAEIAQAARRVGATVGFDLAHAVGNIELSMHDWDIDFACWCSYKYLNSSPGGVGGIYVHDRHLGDDTLPKLLGWWGTRRDTRFEMANVFDDPGTAESWQISNGTALPMAALAASLEIFDEAGGMAALRVKSRQQTEYLYFLLDEVLGDKIESITPRNPDERGCQLSLRVKVPDLDGQSVFAEIEAAGVACDWRFPDVIRVAPAPLFNTYTDIRRFVDILATAVNR